MPGSAAWFAHLIEIALGSWTNLYPSLARRGGTTSTCTCTQRFGRCLSGPYGFRTDFANFGMSFLNNQKELGYHQLCPMGLVGHPIDCRTQMVVVVTLLAVVPAPKLGFLRNVLPSGIRTHFPACIPGIPGRSKSNRWLLGRYSGAIGTWRPHHGAGGLPTAG